MVSRSLEKMMLIAIGLSTAVIVGVPVLMYAIDTITTTSYLEDAQMVADQIHNTTRQVDIGTIPDATIQVHIPVGITMSAEGNTLTILFNYQGVEPQTWIETYDNQIVISPPTEAGNYLMHIDLSAGVIHITFS
jgi:hypothetical protein